MKTGEHPQRKPAVFIDRDGTVNEQMGYINDLSRFKLLPGTAEAVGLLKRQGFLAIILSNQSGIARGYFPIELVHQVHAKMQEELERDGAAFDGIFFCPHHPRGTVPQFTGTCDCRKPGTGLLVQASRSFDIDMAHSYMVGDRCVDLETAKRAGLPGILVKTGYGLGEVKYVLPRKNLLPSYVAGDLRDAVHWILGQKTP